MSSFKNKTILITGGTSGIGKVTALALAEAGANIVITGRRAPEGQAVVADLAKRGGKHLFVQGDVTDEAHLAKAVQTAAAITGRLDGAFNNAGLELGSNPIVEVNPADFHRIFDINVLGVLLSMKHQIKAMLATGGGSIVNNASIAGTIGMPGAGIYIASKHAVLGLTKTAAVEVAKQGIRVNAVSPAAIETDMLDRFTGGRNPEVVTAFAAMHPIGRIGKPSEIAHPVLFLLSDDASFITGHDLKVDGGFTVP
ncbi:MAG: glucose 1-dehydrogenase [Phycisphaerales bacterium]